LRNFSPLHMKRHTPNVIPLRGRVALAMGALFLFFFVLAEVATGYTYLPTKRGGILLSGIPTLMISFSAIALIVALLLTIVDHYDRRPNEASYKKARSVCFKTAIFLFLAAPVVELTEKFLRAAGHNIFPQFKGLANTYTFYSPHLREYVTYLTPVLDHEIEISAVSVVMMLIFYGFERFWKNTGRRLVLLIGFVGLFGLSMVWVVNATENFLTGEVTSGSRSSKNVVHAKDEPAKFNAVLLTHFTLGGFMLIASGFAVVGVLTNRIKPDELGSDQAAKKGLNVARTDR